MNTSAMNLMSPGGNYRMLDAPSLLRSHNGLKSPTGAENYRMMSTNADGRAPGPAPHDYQSHSQHSKQSSDGARFQSHEERPSRNLDLTRVASPMLLSPDGGNYRMLDASPLKDFESSG